MTQTWRISAMINFLFQGFRGQDRKSSSSTLLEVPANHFGAPLLSAGRCGCHCREVLSESNKLWYQADMNRWKLRCWLRWSDGSWSCEGHFPYFFPNHPVILQHHSLLFLCLSVFPGNRSLRAGFTTTWRRNTSASWWRTTTRVRTANTRRRPERSASSGANWGICLWRW